MISNLTDSHHCLVVVRVGNSPHLIPITKELFLFLLTLRYHNPPPTQATPRPARAPVVGLSGSSFLEPTLTSLKLPGDIGISAQAPSSTSFGGQSSLSILTSSLPYNTDLLESILFGLLILATPSSQTLSDDVLLQTFYAEIEESQQWALELWEHFKLVEPGGGDKSKMYCAALLKRCSELLEVRM